MDDKCSTGLIQPLDNNWLAHWHKVLPPLTPGPSWVYFCTFWRLHFFHLPHFFTFQCDDCTSQHFLLFKYYISLQLSTLFFNVHYIPTCQSFEVVTHAIFSLSICTSLLWHLWIIFKQHRKYIFSPHHPPFTKCSAQCTSPILCSWPLSKLGKLIKFALL